MVRDLDFDGEIKGRIGPVSFSFAVPKPEPPPLPPHPSAHLDELVKERDTLLDRLWELNAEIKKLRGR